MRGALVLAATLLFGAAAPTDVERLDPDHQALVRDFQQGKGRARMIAILSPT